MRPSSSIANPSFAASSPKSAMSSGGPDGIPFVKGNAHTRPSDTMGRMLLKIWAMYSVDSSAERANPFGCPTASEMIPLCPSGRTSRISSVASSVTKSDPSERTSTKFGSPIPPSTTRVFSPSGVMRQTIPSALGPVSKRLVGPKSAIRMSRSPIGANPRLE